MLLSDASFLSSAAESRCILLSDLSGALHAAAALLSPGIEKREKDCVVRSNLLEDKVRAGWKDKVREGVEEVSC
jgi:hypothetical protein